MGQSLIEAANL